MFKTTKVFLAIAFFGMMTPLMARADELTQADLDRCLVYFTEGNPMQWIGGGVTIAFGLFFAFTKKSLPSVIKDAAKWLMEQKAKK